MATFSKVFLLPSSCDHISRMCLYVGAFLAGKRFSMICRRPPTAASKEKDLDDGDFPASKMQATFAIKTTHESRSFDTLKRRIRRGREGDDDEDLATSTTLRKV